MGSGFTNNIFSIISRVKFGDGVYIQTLLLFCEDRDTVFDILNSRHGSEI